MREWALNRWPENTQIDLSKELVRLKAEIKLQREIDEAALQEHYGAEELDDDCQDLTDLRAR